MDLTRYSIKNFMAVYALVVIIIVVGSYSYIKLPRESSPDITIPFVIVSTVYPGVAPSDIETLVTQELEKELKNLGNVKEMRSSSKEGVSVISVEFDPSVDIDEAVQKVRDKVGIAKPKLPDDAEEPSVMEINFSDIPIMIVNVSGEYGLVRLKKIAEGLQDKLEQVPGVLEVKLIGGLEKEVQVDVDPERLLYYNLSFKDIVDLIRDENVTIPGGSIDIGDYKYLVRVPGEFENPQVIKDLVIKARDQKPIYVRDLADVNFGFKDASSFARLDGIDCISLTVSKRSGENIIEVSDAVKEVINSELKELPRSTEIVITADQSTDTRNLLNDLENNVITGLLLVLIVLFFFLGLRVAIFVALSIPFSMLISFFILSALGFTLNMVVLFSLILALGMLVDNAIVIVENIYRHMEEGSPRAHAALEGTREVARPVIFSTITTICAFFPVIFWPGIMGEFMKYLPMTLIITLSSSLFVALVINPTLCATMLKPSGRHKKKLNETADEDLGPVLIRYKKFLDYSLARGVRTFLLAVLSLVAVMVAYGYLGKGVEFFPMTDPTKIFVDVEAPTGTNAAASDKMATIVERIAGQYKDVETYVTNVGVSTGQFDFTGQGDAGPSHKSRIAVDFVDREEREQRSTITEDEIRTKARDAIIGATVKISAQQMGPPTGPPINIEISGREYDQLAVISGKVEAALKDVPGLVDIENDYSAGTPELKIVIDREKAAKYGFKTLNIANVIRSAIYGAKASTYREGKDEYDIRVRMKLNRRNKMEKLSEFFIKHEGNTLPLTSFADITTTSGYSDISHIDQKRVVTVSSDVAPGVNANAKLAEVKEILEESVEAPEGYRVAYTGQNKEQKDAEEFLIEAFMGAVFLISFILILQFNSIVTPIIIMSSVILSMIGVLIGLMATGTPFGVIMTGLGVISLAGVVVNNSIVLLDYMIQLREKGLEKKEAIITAGMTRLRPVLLTAITTMLGLMPMVTGVSFDFHDFSWVTESDSTDWWGPMAVAVVFGLGVATLLTLVVAPVLYSMLDTFATKVFGGALTHTGEQKGSHDITA